jgi:N-acetylglucosamine-6-sulfatase
VSRRTTSFVLIVAALAGWALAPGARPTPAHAATGPPNIVVILTDDQTPDSIPHSPAVMPVLQGMITDPADSWVRFSHAYHNVSLCCPSRATLLSGQYDTHTGVKTNGNGPLFDESSTVATWLQTAGYHTGFTGKYLNNWPYGRGLYTPPGWDEFVAFITDEDRYYHYRLYDPDVPGLVEEHADLPEDYSTTVVADRAVAFIEEAPADQPFFLLFAPRAPHPPSIPPPGSKGAYKSIAPTHAPSFNEADVSDKPDWVQALPLLGDRAVKKADAGRRKSYEALIGVDRAVEDVTDALAAAGELENTVIFYLTDNGYAFGDHRFTGKTCQYVQCATTPLFVRIPGATARVEPALATNVDIAPTIAALAGATPTIPQDGRSLTPFLEGTAPGAWREGVLIHWVGSKRTTGYWGVYTRDYLYTELSSGVVRVELYDLTGQLGPADPDELDNRATDPAYAEVRAQLAALLSALQATAAEPTVIEAAGDHPVASPVSVLRTRERNR